MINRPAAILSAALIVTMLAAALWALQRVPDATPIAVHFDRHGDANGWMPPWPGLFMPVAMAMVVWAIFAALPTLDPRRANLERSGKAYGVVWLASIALAFFAQMAILAHALGTVLDAAHAIRGAFGVFLILVGNVLGKLRSNHLIGIRVPWTLADDWVWEQTHRFGGWVFVVAGAIICASAAIAPAGRPIRPDMVTVVLAAALATTLKSYLLWRQRPSKSN